MIAEYTELARSVPLRPRLSVLRIVHQNLVHGGRADGLTMEMKSLLLASVSIHWL